MSLLHVVPINPEPNTPLVPNESGYIGNALFLKMIKGEYFVVTDFGNSMKLTYSEINKMFSIPDWFYKIEEDFIILTPRERFSQQVYLLNEVLRTLDD